MAQATGANIGFEDKLWQAADKMRNNMDAAEYKHVVLGLIFLKYISDSFQEKYNQLLSEDPGFAEDKDEYIAENIFWVPKEARWNEIQANAKQSTIGTLIDNAMIAIEKENPTLKGVLRKDYSRPTLDKRNLGELVDLIGSIDLIDKENKSKDVLGRVYEYFLSKFASAEGKGGGEFYTPQCVVKLLVEMLEPYQGRVYDPCCGSGGMFVQSENFVLKRGGRLNDIAVYGQESNPTTWQLCKMNLAIRGIESNLGTRNADSFHNDLHKDLKADYIIANPPFNISDWGGENLQSDVRWKFGNPPAGNANYAWIQHFIHHLAPTGTAGFVLANGSMSSNTSNEGVIRQALVEKDMVDCMVALPGQLFYTTQIPVCLWFVTRNKEARFIPGDGKFRNRQKETLFIDARKMGSMIDRVHRELTEDDIQKIAGTYHNWRSEEYGTRYKDIAGFCKASNVEEIEKNGFILTPGRYVGVEEQEDDGVSFEEKMTKFTADLSVQFKQSDELEARIKANLAKIGFGV